MSVYVCCIVRLVGIKRKCKEFIITMHLQSDAVRSRIVAVLHRFEEGRLAHVRILVGHVGRFQIQRAGRPGRIVTDRHAANGEEKKQQHVHVLVNVDNETENIVCE